jgi:hypothetical protein
MVEDVERLGPWGRDREAIAGPDVIDDDEQLRYCEGVGNGAFRAAWRAFRPPGSQRP